MASGKMLCLRQALFSPKIAEVPLIVRHKSTSKMDALIKQLGLPKRPKKPPNQFLTYVNIHKSQIIAKNPDLSPKDVIKVLAQRWEKEPEEEKKKYNKDYKAKMKIYEADKVKFNEVLSGEVGEKFKELMEKERIVEFHSSVLRKLKQQEKDLNKPKYPTSPFLLYLKKAGLLEKQKLREGSEMWRKLPEMEKEKYCTAFTEALNKYKDDLLKWEEKMLVEGNIDLVRLKTIQQKLNSYAQA